MKTLFALAFAASLVSTSAVAQVTSLQAENAGPRGQDLNKVICEVDSTTGTRLDNHKVCKTVLEWQEMRRSHREQLEGVQRQGTSVGCQEGQSCGG